MRSPGLIGAGALLSFDVRCVIGPNNQTGPCPPEIRVGQSVDLVVRGNFQDGSTRDITGLERIEFSASSGAVTVIGAGADKGRVTGASETGDTPVVVTVTDADGQAAPPTRTVSFTVIDPAPTNVQIRVPSNGSSNPVPANFTIPSGVPQQFIARVTFQGGITEDFTTSPNVQWSRAPTENSSINQSGLFTGQNTGEDPIQFTVTAQFDADNFAPIQGSANVAVTPAEYVGGSLRLVPAAASLIIGEERDFTALGSFIVGQNEDGTAIIVERDITQRLGSLMSSDNEKAAFVEDPEKDVDNTLLAKEATAPAAPVTITATFTTPDGSVDEAMSTVIIREPDFAEIKLVPFGVAPFEAAGYFRFLEDGGATPEQIEDVREQIAADARALGLTDDGRLPICVEGEGDCPNDALAENQVLPSTILSYAVFARRQGDPGFGEEDSLGDWLVNFDNVPCDDGTNLFTTFAGSDEIILVDDTDQIEDDGAPVTVPAVSRSGARVVFVEGLAEGSGTARARLGRDFSEGDNGLNCRSEPVTDAEQLVTVGFQENDTPLAIQKSTFNIDKNFTCVGFTNAANIVEGSDPRGRDKLLSSLTYELADARRILVNINQQHRLVDFRSLGGPANTNGVGCRNDADPAGETDPSISITSAINVERGVITADGPAGLASNCAAADFNPRVDPPGFSESPRTRGATVVVLPADDQIISGQSGISDDEIDELCDGLGPLLTLPVSQFFGEQDAGLLVEIIFQLETVLGPVLNSEEVEDDLGPALLEIEEELSSGLGLLLDTTGLDEVLDEILGIIGIGGTSPAPDGLALLPTLIDGIGIISQALKDAFIEAGGGDPEPETADPGDPFRQQESDGE